MFPALTLPPYCTRTFSPTSVENMVSSVSRIARTTSAASVGAHVLPVPIAQIGS
jgi:hypothetical protein